MDMYLLLKRTRLTNDSIYRELEVQIRTTSVQNIARYLSDLVRLERYRRDSLLKFQQKLPERCNGAYDYTRHHPDEHSPNSSPQADQSSAPKAGHAESTQISVAGDQYDEVEQESVDEMHDSSSSADSEVSDTDPGNQSPNILMSEQNNALVSITEAEVLQPSREISNELESNTGEHLSIANSDELLQAFHPNTPKPSSPKPYDSNHPMTAGKRPRDVQPSNDNELSAKRQTFANSRSKCNIHPSRNELFTTPSRNHSQLEPKEIKTCKTTAYSASEIEMMKQHYIKSVQDKNVSIGQLEDWVKQRKNEGEFANRIDSNIIRHYKMITRKIKVKARDT